MNNTIAVISDIHSNLAAFQQALQIIHKEGIDSIFCCGDVIGYGNEANECCELIRSLNCRTVAGNHDLAVIGKTAYRDTFSRKAIAAIEQTASTLSDENRAWLGALPLIHREEELLFTHASLHFPGKWLYVTAEQCSTYGVYQNVRESFDRMTGSICFVGHSHLSSIFIEKQDETIEVLQPDSYPYKLQGRAIIDVGSIGKVRTLGNEGSFVIFDREERMARFVRFPLDGML